MFSLRVNLIISEEVSTKAGSQRESLPTYPGVPQAVAITSPVPSIFDKPKSLIMIFDSSWGLKYSRFSGWRVGGGGQNMSTRTVCKGSHQSSRHTITAGTFRSLCTMPIVCR